jgi:hypothetical protein
LVDVSADNGFYEGRPVGRPSAFRQPAGYATPHRMNSSSSLLLNLAPGTLTISGTVRWADIRGSMAGVYTGSVVDSILP